MEFLAYPSKDKKESRPFQSCRIIPCRVGVVVVAEGNKACQVRGDHQASAIPVRPRILYKLYPYLMKTCLIFMNIYAEDCSEGAPNPNKWRNPAFEPPPSVQRPSQSAYISSKLVNYRQYSIIKFYLIRYSFRPVVQNCARSIGFSNEDGNVTGYTNTPSYPQNN